jgi:hypothetical protein
VAEPAAAGGSCLSFFLHDETANNTALTTSKRLSMRQPSRNALDVSMVAALIVGTALVSLRAYRGGRGPGQGIVVERS